MSLPQLPACPLPVFESAAFLRAHVHDILAFYRPTARDPEGGFFHYFRDDGQVYNRTHRHLVSATRFVFNWAQAWQHTRDPLYRDWAAHGLAHLQKAFRTADGDWVWTVNHGQVEDGRIMAYGQAFALLAHAHAHTAGLCSAADVVAVFERLSERFYEPQHQAYADERSADGQLSPYRGQNANMHLCEACIAAYDATGDTRFLDRAQALAGTFALRLTDPATGQIWEHYDTQWQPDWTYNQHSPGDIFKPWGFQTGHQTEWAKLLLQLHQHQPDPRWVARAAALQRMAYARGWDAQEGGLVYGYAPDGTVCDHDKYFWVQAESLASAWRLWRVTGDPAFLEQYRAIWAWAWTHLVDHQLGAWFRVVARDGGKLENTKSPAGKTDYHTMGACWDVLRVGGLDV
jgi:mannose/cellobiose epimerase-like protein (N-acyl-D-glucosamine 2-epimerase family)